MAFGIQNYAGFVGAIVVFQAIPGPGILAILGATARGGVAGGMGAVLGTLSGDFLFMLCAVLGLASLLAALPAVLAVLQWFGLAYLCWLGVQLLRTPTSLAQADRPAPPNWPAHYRKALLVCLTNPKAILFFTAFFPLFLAPDAGGWTLLGMMAHVTLLSFAYQSLVVFIGDRCARRLARYRWLPATLRRLAGVSLIGFGLRLAAEER